ncbi:MAG: nicotinamide riboside transporter PnuC [Burkholderiaceae bacterium]|nr:nicotinamide riboside transporter PnuC [Burkholderiaceae bacterium]
MLDTAFSLLGAPVTWLELLAFVLALACVACNILEIHWGWPLAIASSLLYGWLFFASKLYGEAGLQLFFVATAAWGWWQWLYGTRVGATPPIVRARTGAPRRDAGGAPLAVASLTRAGLWRAIVAWALGWIALGAFLATATDSEVPFLDAFPSAGSLLGQVLLGRKFIENWPVWVVVNAASIALFASRGLWLTTVLYAIFLAMALAGWWRWRRVRAANAESRSPLAGAA